MSFKLTYLSSIVELRNPDPNDVHRVILNDIRRFTRSGDFKGKSDATHWYSGYSHVYKFSNIRNTSSAPVIDDLRTFLILTAGKEIEIEYDYINPLAPVTIVGFILTPVNEIIAERPLCTYSVSFEFLETPL